VDQQAAHLSNAEIEQYGEMALSPEPKAEDRRDRVEAHLADCPACRGRVLSSQRARLALLAASPVTTTPNADRPGPGRPGSDVAGLSHRGPDCPDEDDLRHLAAGICPPDQAVQLTQHAAQCDHCGPVLRMFTEDFSDELSDEDAALLGKLKSSSGGWQKKLAQEMLEQAGGSRESSDSAALSGKTGVRKIFPWRWVLAPAALAASAAIAFGVWYQQRETPEKVEKLLAQAYTENRQLEMRIPYAKRADFHQLRSGDSESLLNSPASLRRATDVIASELKEHPDDPKWLLLSARLDLLDWHYKPALVTLDKLTGEKVSDSHDWQLARALALYEKAELEPEQHYAYGEAIDLLARVLQKNPDDIIALHNQAVTCEKAHMYGCARADWEHVLALEKDSGWLAEAREHLDRIQEKKNLGQ
jgi:tetratricopeptide (TPR) repeat protein